MSVGDIDDKDHQVRFGETAKDQSSDQPRHTIEENLEILKMNEARIQQLIAE